MFGVHREKSGARDSRRGSYECIIQRDRIFSPVLARQYHDGVVDQNLDPHGKQHFDSGAGPGAIAGFPGKQLRLCDSRIVFV